MQAHPNFISPTTYLYAKYRISKAVECNTALRDFLKAKTHQKAQIVPTRVGRKGKYTEEGAIRCFHLDSKPMPVSSRYRGATISICSISEDEFMCIKLTSNRKIYFRGFPLDAVENDVIDMFYQFGSIEFVYFMKESKSGKRTNRQGYFIYEDHESLKYLLASGHNFWCRGKKIHYEEYNTTKENYNSNFRPTIFTGHPESLHSPRINALEFGASTPQKAHMVYSETFEESPEPNEVTLYSHRYKDTIPLVRFNSLDVLNIRINIVRPGSLATAMWPKKWIDHY